MKPDDPPGEARQDWKIIWDLARRMGCPMKPYANEAEIFHEIAAVTPIMAGTAYHRIERQGLQWPCPTGAHPGTPTLFLKQFDTASGRAVLHPVAHVPQTEKIASRQGEISTRLKASRDVLPGELFIPFHFGESPVKELTRDELDPYSKIAPFKLTACRVSAHQ